MRKKLEVFARIGQVSIGIIIALLCVGFAICALPNEIFPKLTSIFPEKVYVFVGNIERAIGGIGIIVAFIVCGKFVLTLKDNEKVCRQLTETREHLPSGRHSKPRLVTRKFKNEKITNGSKTKTATFNNQKYQIDGTTLQNVEDFQKYNDKFFEELGIL